MKEEIVNEEEVENTLYSFTAYEFDLDYEFDAAQFFDFSQEESPLEAHKAELWFDSAGSYPPPFVARLVPRDDQVILMMANVSLSPESESVESMKSDSDDESDHEIVNVMEMKNRYTI